MALWLRYTYLHFSIREEVIVEPYPQNRVLRGKGNIRVEPGLAADYGHCIFILRDDESRVSSLPRLLFLDSFRADGDHSTPQPGANLTILQSNVNEVANASERADWYNEIVTKLALGVERATDSEQLLTMVSVS